MHANPPILHFRGRRAPVPDPCPENCPHLPKRIRHGYDPYAVCPAICPDVQAGPRN